MSTKTDLAKTLPGKRRPLDGKRRPLDVKRHPLHWQQFIEKEEWTSGNKRRPRAEISREDQNQRPLEDIRYINIPWSSKFERSKLLTTLIRGRLVDVVVLQIQTYTLTSRDLKYQTWAGKHLQLLEQKFHEVSKGNLFGKLAISLRAVILCCWTLNMQEFA